jgi:hypothetical protein
MSASKNNDQNGKPVQILERDVLGLEKDKGNSTTNKAKPNRIFIGFAVVIIIAIVYWLVSK